MSVNWYWSPIIYVVTLLHMNFVACVHLDTVTIGNVYELIVAL